MSKNDTVKKGRRFARVKIEEEATVTLLAGGMILVDGEAVKDTSPAALGSLLLARLGVVEVN